MGTTTNNRARLLDLTRLISRAGRALTGVDRVELAYLQHLAKAGPLFGLIRSSLGYMLLDSHGCAILQEKITRGDWGQPDVLSKIKRGLDPMRARAESDMRKHCIARCLPLRLARMLRKSLPRGLTYFNVGHSNLNDRVVSALQGVDARIIVMVHDTIPLDVPQYQRPETLQRFRQFMTRVRNGSDVVICNSLQTQRDVIHHLGLENTPKTVVAPLGVDVPKVGTPPNGPWTHPYFVTIGTIEPRKNHALLLDIWPGIDGADLLICGGRGWENHDTFARLDQHPDRIFELPGLPDDQMFALLQGSAGLLFPSFAEGYGLPPIEAAALNIPVICNDLGIYKEILGDIPIYADVTDSYLWQKKINELAQGHRAEQDRRASRTVYEPPTWSAHFKAVLTMT